MGSRFLLQNYYEWAWNMWKSWMEMQLLSCNDFPINWLRSLKTSERKLSKNTFNWRTCVISAHLEAWVWLKYSWSSHSRLSGLAQGCGAGCGAGARAAEHSSHLWIQHRTSAFSEPQWKCLEMSVMHLSTSRWFISLWYAVRVAWTSSLFLTTLRRLWFVAKKSTSSEEHRRQMWKTSKSN